LGLRVKSQSEKKDIDNSDFSSSQEASNIEKIDEFIPEMPVLVKRRSVSLDARHADQTKESSSEVEPVDKKVVNNKHPELSIDSAEKTAIENIVITKRPSSQFLREKSSSFLNKTTVLRKDSRHSIKAIEYVLPKEAPKWVEHIFEKYIKGKTMWKVPTEEKINHDEWNIIQDNGQFRIMQSKKKPTVFKCLFSLENGALPEKLLQVI